MKSSRLVLALVLVLAHTLPASVPAARAARLAAGATFTVTNSLDSGVGSLRWAIEQANISVGSDTINFNASRSIQPLTPLPPITDHGTVIDASAVWDGTWPTGKPGIRLGGDLIPMTPTIGLSVVAAQGVVIKGLTVEGFDIGIALSFGASNAAIGSGAPGGRMVLRANRMHGILIEAADDNKVVGSYIGTSYAGNLPEPNGGNGVYIVNGKRNRIGVVGAQIEQNLIGASGMNGIAIEGNDAISNTVENNSIGVGTLNGPITNTLNGVFIGGGASWNGVGGVVYRLPGGTTVYSSTMGNTIYGSGLNGILVQDSNTTKNGLMRNMIEESRRYGIHFDGAFDNTAGYNTVVRSAQTGVMLGAANANWLLSNWVGTDPWGNMGLGSGHHAIGLYDGAWGNYLNQNFAVNSGWSGIAIVNSSTTQNWLLENRIGVGPEGQAMGNAFHGVHIFGSSSNALTLNELAFNGQGLPGNFQILVEGATAIGNELHRNSIRHYGGSGAMTLASGGNHMLTPPSITAAGCRSVSGIGAGSYGFVELFSGELGDATRFEGATYADAAGNWALSNLFTRGPTLTATRANTPTVPLALSALRPPGAQQQPRAILRLPGGDRIRPALAEPRAGITALETSPLAASVPGGCALRFLPVIWR